MTRRSITRSFWSQLLLFFLQRLLSSTPYSLFPTPYSLFPIPIPYFLVVMAVAALIWGTGKPGVGVAEFRMVETIVSALQSGWAARKRAATPAAKGAEALVPMAWTYEVCPRLKHP